MGWGKRRLSNREVQIWEEDFRSRWEIMPALYKERTTIERTGKLLYCFAVTLQLP